MSEWLRNLLGLEDREIPTDAVTAFEFANMPRGAAALVLFLLVGFLIASVFWIYRREGSAKRGVKITLAVFRSLVIVAVALLLLEPVLAIDRIDEVEKKTLLLLDESYSMTTRDRYQDPMEKAALRVALGPILDASTRTDLVNAALRKSDLVSRLARNNPVEVFRFADGLVPTLSVPRMPGGGGAASVPALDPTKNPGAAKGTNLTHAVRQAVEEIGSDRVAAVILISDGRSNLGAPPEDLPVFLRNKALKLYTVAVGDDEPARNLRAVALAGPERMFRRDPANFEAKVSARGFESATVIFERRYKDQEVWERIETRPVAFVRDGAVVDLTFADKPTKTGVLDYRIRIDPEAEEATERDNQKSFRTVVVDEKAKVLLIAGGPSHEYRAVKNVLLRDRTIQLACYLQSADPKFPQDGNDISLPDLPNDEKGLFTFDVVILCDPNGTRFPPGFTDLLKKFVSEHRGGLGFVAGNQHTLALLRPDRETHGIVDLLPVVLDYERADDPIYGVGLRSDFQDPWQMVPEAVGLRHPATRFHPDATLARDGIWKRLPPLYWSFPVLKEKPGAIVLVRHSDPRETVQPYGRRPILAAHRYGGGQVLFLAADETYRWRSTAEKVFDRFWVQSTRFLLEGRHAGARKRFRVYLDQEIVDLGEAVNLTAEVYDERYKPLDPETLRDGVVEVDVKGPGSIDVRVELTPVEGHKGQFSGSFAPALRGEYSVFPADTNLTGTQSTDSPAATFEVRLPDNEMGDVRVDRGLMRMLADRTGGWSVPLHDLAALGKTELIPPATERVITSGRPLPLWDTWATVLAILILLCAEWILRKKHRMV